MDRKVGFALLVFSVVVWGQDPAPQGGGWRRFNNAAQPERPVESDQLPEQAAAPSGAIPPPVLNLNAGTMITVRVDQLLSSDHNRAGDTFSATLVQPLVVNGFIVARRGQTIAGRVSEADKGGRVQGTSRLGIELFELSLVDGQQVPIRTQLLQHSAGTSTGRDAAAIGASTGIGAAIGAAADGGFGAGMGAIAGAGASIIGVLVTRGHPTEVYPESVLTFRTLEPVSISTDRSTQAFEPVRQGDYGTQAANRQPSLARRGPGYYGGYPYPYAYPGWYGPGLYGPSIYIRTGPRFYGRRGRW